MTNYTNHAGPQWRNCPLCERRTHLNYTSLEWFEHLKSFGFFDVSVEIECTHCRLKVEEPSKGRDYGTTLTALRRRWNNRGGLKRGKAVFPR